jgi:hypothetical protein
VGGSPGVCRGGTLLGGGGGLLLAIPPDYPIALGLELFGDGLALRRDLRPARRHKHSHACNSATQQLIVNSALPGTSTLPAAHAKAPKIA